MYNRKETVEVSTFSCELNLLPWTFNCPCLRNSELHVVNLATICRLLVQFVRK